MRVAIHTILWGHRPADVGRMLREIKDAGYDGVEFWQHPVVLGPAKTLYGLLRDLQLCFVGIAGGSQVERIKFLRQIVDTENIALARDRADKLFRVANFPRGVKPYICVERWEREGAHAARENGFLLGLHPHMFRSIQTADEAEAEMQAHSDLYFLPDVAHLTVAGEDVIDVLNRNLNRLIGIHLKDWSAEYGRAYQFYARGFVELGMGEVQLDAVVDLLKSRRYTGWLVVDQNFTLDASKSARDSRAWLRVKHGI